MTALNDFKKAVLIGSSTFPNSRGALRPLRCPAADVEAMRGALADEERCWFNPIHILLDASHNDVLVRINEVLRDADKEDLVLVYYSGHGLLDTLGKLHLATADTDETLLPATSVPLSAIRDCLLHSRCQRFVLVLDCCYAGAAGRQFAGKVKERLDEFSGDLPGGVGEFVLTASTAVEAAEQKENDRLSVFTKHFVNGIRSGAADTDGDGLIRLEELYEFVRGGVLAESHQEPQRWALGSAGSFILARTPDATQNLIQESVREKLRQRGIAERLPPAILAGLREMTKMKLEEFRTKHNGTGALAYAWARGDVKTKDLIDQWYRLRTDLSGVDQASEVPGERRWRVVDAARVSVLDLVGPTYLLDNNYHFLDWNPAFDELVAKPLRLVRGSHAEDFILALANSREVIERAQEKFKPKTVPLVDTEILKFQTERYGLITFRKIAGQIAQDADQSVVWCITLNIHSAEREAELWEDLHRRLEREVNWSRYAVSYDRMLLEFDDYGTLLDDVTKLVGDARVCADIGAGTGNSALRLLNANPDRRVWAFENNEAMLQHLRTKMLENDAARRLTTYKGDAALSLREFPEGFFDGAVMVNVLYALDEPARLVSEIFRVLKPGATLALSTAHRDTDVAKLFAAIRASLEEKGLAEQLRAAVFDAEDRHRQMMDRIHRDTREDVIRYLTTAGFEIASRQDSAYVDAVMIVEARKPAAVAPTPAPAKPARKSQPAQPAQAAPPAAPALGSRDQIFISYSHKDKEALEKLQLFFRPLVRAKRVKIWDDTGLRAGDRWEPEIQAAITRARVAVLLVSQNFLDSEFIMEKELPAILEAAQNDGIKIFWIPLSASTYKFTDIKSLQAAFDPKTPLDSFAAPGQNQLLTSLVEDVLAQFP